MKAISANQGESRSQQQCAFKSPGSLVTWFVQLIKLRIWCSAPSRLRSPAAPLPAAPIMDDGAAGLDDAGGAAHFPPQPRGVSFKLSINTVSHPPTSPSHEVNTHMEGAHDYQKLPGDVFLSPRMGIALSPKQPVEPANMASRSPKSRNPSSSIYKPELQPLTARLARPPRYNRQRKIDRSIGSHYESSMLGGVQPGAKFAQSTWQGCRHRFRAQAPDPAFRFQTVAQFGEESVTDVSKAALPFSQMPRCDINYK